MKGLEHQTANCANKNMIYNIKGPKIAEAATVLIYLQINSSIVVCDISQVEPLMKSYEKLKTFYSYLQGRKIDTGALITEDILLEVKEVKYI